MKQGTILLCVLVVLSAMGIATAAEGDLGIDLDTTWVSKYIWRGFDLYGDKGAIQPSVNFNLYDTGFSFNVWSSYCTSSGYVDGTEYDYTVAYANSFNAGDTWQTDYAVSYVYYDFPDAPSTAADGQEFNASVAFPNACPAGIVPSYTLIKFWPAKSDSDISDAGGWIHYMRLDYPVAFPGIFENNPEQVINFSWDITYNDGAAGNDIDSDWSHTVFGASTAIEMPVGTLSPGIYYQISMEDTVNTEDELWTGVSYSLSF